MKALKLKEAVDYVRKTYFPKWDMENVWVIKYAPDHPKVVFCHGICLKETRTIYLAMLPENDVELYLLIIHEICHAFGSGHEAKWQGRMLKAAEQAEKNGDNELSIKIIEQVEGYRKSPRITCQMVYGQLYDAVVDIKGEVSFEHIREFLARDYGSSDAIDKYKRLRKVYDKAVKYTKEMIRIKRELRKKMKQ